MRPLTEQPHRMRRFRASEPTLKDFGARVTRCLTRLLGRIFMAKALLGYVGSDSRLLEENQRLRRRLADLEAVVLRLQAENDALAAHSHDGELLVVPDTIRNSAPAGV